MGQQTVHGVLDLLGRQALQLLRGEHPVYRYLHPTHTLIQAVLGIGQVAAGYLGVVHRDAHHLQKLARAGHHRLGHARDGTHSLGHNAQVAAPVDDAAHLSHAVQIRGEILLGNDLGKLQQQAGRESKKLVISHHIVELIGIAHRAGELVVHPRGVVADDDERLSVLTGVGLIAEGGMCLPVENLHHQHEYPIEKAVGRFHLSGQ